MLMRKIFDNGKRYISIYSSMPRRNIQKIEDAQVIEPKISLPEHKNKLDRKEPFLKNVFLARFDRDFLTFLEPQTDERYKKFLEWMKPIENYMTSITSTIEGKASRGEVFEKLKELGILRARIKQDYDGLSMSQVETLKLLETLSSMPWLATSFIKNNIVPIDLISKYGNEEQKRKYFPKIGNGELLPTICITEVNSGPNVETIDTTAVLSECNNFWILNGKKIFVTNGEDSNLFLVIGHCAKDLNTRYHSLTTFIVESSHGGITFHDGISTVGQQEVHVCTVEFKDTRVPKENVLGKIGQGKDFLISVFSPGSNRVAGEAIGILRNFLSLLNENVLRRKHLDKSMHNFEAVRNIVAEITCSLYGMESVAYFTNSIDDVYKDQDLELERAVVETYCGNECVQQIYKGLQVIGVEGYLKDNPYIKLYNDALGLSIYDGSVIDEKEYIALLGLQYTGKNIYQDVAKTRNVVFHPAYLFKRIFFDIRPKKLYLFEHLHPSLRLHADALEEFVFTLADISVHLLEAFGAEVPAREMIMQKLAGIAIEVYVSIAVLARTSRSYSIGVRNSDYERFIAMLIVQRAQKRIEMFEKDLRSIELQNNVKATDLISETIFQKKGYICENPLTRTF